MVLVLQVEKVTCQLRKSHRIWFWIWFKLKKNPPKKKLMKRLNGIIRCCRKDGGDKIYFLPLSFSLTRNASSCCSYIPIWMYHINSLCIDDEIGLVHLLMIHGGSQSFRTEACCHCHIFAWQFISFDLFFYLKFLPSACQLLSFY